MAVLTEFLGHMPDWLWLWLCLPYLFSTF